MASHFSIYIARDIKNPFEIEHIWADHYEQHTDEFNTPEEFAQYRNHIGNLILLPSDINRSINDNCYEQKLPVYRVRMCWLNPLMNSFTIITHLS